MALRISWDKQETAILIDAYLRVKNGELSQQNAVKEVSALLRRRAVLSGVEIDEIFRNENGISMQMKIVGGLVDEKPSGLHSTTKMFTEMVALYKTQRSEFNEILIQAKGECAMRVNVQEKFFTWLSTRVSSTQLPKFYSVCRNIETFCMNKHILVAPLFETTDFKTLRRVTNTIRTNRMFQLKYLRQLGKMKMVMEFYLIFLRENPIPREIEVDVHKEEPASVVDANFVGIEPSEVVTDEEITVKTNSVDHTKDSSSSQEVIVEVDVVDEEIKTGADPAYKDIVPAETTKNESNNFVWNFANERIDFSNTNPTEVSYFGERKKCNGWQSAFTQIIIYLLEDYPAIIRGMVGYRFAGVGKVILSGRAGFERFSKAKELNNRLYLETDCTPDEIVTIVCLLMSKCNMDYENIEITYEPCRDKKHVDAADTPTNVVAAESQDATVKEVTGNIEDDEEPVNEGIHDYIVHILDEMNIAYVDHRSNQGCLWVIGDTKLSAVFSRLEAYKVVFHYKADGGHATKGEPAWWTKDIVVTTAAPEQDVVEETVQSNDVEKQDKIVVTSAYERKSAFENWLISDIGLAERSAQSYSSAVNIAGQYSVRLGLSDKALYFILDAEQVYQISTKLLADPDFAKLNEGQHNRYHAALSKYRDYCYAFSGRVTVNAPVNATSGREDKVKKNRVAFIAWAQAQQIQRAVIMAYLSEIKKCSEFAKEYNYIQEEHILLIEDAGALERVFVEMRKDSRFAKLNNERQKHPVSAMKKLIAFRKATANTTTATPAPETQITSIEKPAQHPITTKEISSVDIEARERYAEILAKNFVDGFRPAKAIDRNRFRMYYNDMFGQELAEDDEQLICALMKIGTLRDERIFVKDETEQKDLLEEINGTIMETFKAGASCIYLDCLFIKFQEQLAEMLHIYNVDSLESVLFSSRKRNYFKRYNYLFCNNKEPAPAKDVVEYMKNSHLPVTYSEIENGLWYIPLDKIKHTLVTTPGIVNVASEAYLYAPNLPVGEREIQQIAELISHALLQRSYISDVELMQLIEEYCPSVLMNTPDYPMWGLRNALAYLLREKFSFRGAIISEKNEEISMAEVFTDFCRRSERITVDELKQFAGELNTSIYWDSVYGEMVRVNQNEFVCRDQIPFDIEQTDSVLDILIQSDYAPIKTIDLFLHFPAIGVPWNNFVLESYVANYSKKFRLLHAGYTATDCCGAVVRQESGIADYRTLIVDVLAKNTGWKNSKDALQLLVDLGYQQRRSYSDIEIVMQEARARVMRV